MKAFIYLFGLFGGVVLVFGFRFLRQESLYVDQAVLKKI